MQEQFKEKISLLLDGELGKPHALSLLKKLHQHEELRAKLHRYQVVSQVIKHDYCHPLDKSFAEKVRQQINDEPSFFLPAKKSSLNWRKTGLALAASILLATVWLANKTANQPGLPFGQASLALTVPPPQQLQIEPVNDRFNDYLQAHDNSVYVNRPGQALPYARVVGFQQE
jgi:sigma-E factor negative regulatory protein RseA